MNKRNERKCHLIAAIRAWLEQSPGENPLCTNAAIVHMTEKQLEFVLKAMSSAYAKCGADMRAHSASLKAQQLQMACDNAFPRTLVRS